MAPLLVNSTSYGVAGSGTFGLTLPFTPTQGNKLLLSISHYANSLVAIIRTTGVVWSFVNSNLQGSGSSGTNTEHWIGDVVDASPGTNLDITHIIGFTDAAIGVHEISGLRDIWPADKLSFETGSATPGDTDETDLPFHPESYFFGALGGSDSSAGTIPGAPSNGFTKREEDIGPNANLTIGHRITTFDKIVSTNEKASSQLAYGGFTNWVGLMTTLRGSNEPAKPTQLIQKTSAAVATIPDTVSLTSPPQDNSTIIALFVIDSGEEILDINQAGVSSWVQDVAITHINNNIRVEIWRSAPTINATGDLLITKSGTCVATAFVEEYSGILEAVPLDQSASNQGWGGVVTSGLTTAIDSKDELIIGVLGQLDIAADFYNASKYKREQQDVTATFVGAVFRNDESFATLQYQIRANTGVLNDWVGCIASYRNAVSGTAEGPSVGIVSDELNQGGTSTPISSSTFSPLVAVPGGSFVNGHRQLILATARVDNFNGVMAAQLNISGTPFDSASFRPFAPGTSTRSEIWAVCRLATLTNTDSVSVDFKYVSGSVGAVHQVNLVVVDLDSINLFLSRDWFHEEDTTVIPDMNTTFANNVGSTLSFLPDGASSYLVIGHARMSCDASTPVNNENVVRLRDTTNTTTLAQGGWHKELSADVNIRAYNVVGVLETPLNSNLDLAIEMIGGGGGNGWQHEDSSISVIRLDAFFSANFDHNPALNQVGPGNILPPTSGAVLAQSLFPYEPDSNGEIVTIVYAEANNVAADADGIASQAQFPGVVRSLWDTEDTTLGNVVSASSEVLAGNYSVNDADTRIPTFGVSHRVGIPALPGTAEWFNAGVLSNASVINRVVMACFGRAVVPPPAQSDPPEPVPTPTVTTVLQEKPPGQHEEEALDNQLEQFKPGSI